MPDTREPAYDWTKLDIEGIRSFIQRAEVRLGTMHRIGGSFVGGAGLLLLLPFMFRDYLTRYISTAIEVIHDNPNNALEVMWIGSFIISLSLVFSIWLLLRDLIQFFFVPHNTEESSETVNTFYPRLGLSALSYPIAASDKETKDIITAATFNRELIKFVVPHSPHYKKFYRRVLQNYPKIIPSSPREAYNPNNEADELNEYLTACGISGLGDRSIVAEVARIEASLIRHNIGLRGIVLNYAKALILLIWTTLLLALGSAFLDVANKDSPAQFLTSHGQN